LDQQGLSMALQMNDEFDTSRQVGRYCYFGWSGFKTQRDSERLCSSSEMRAPTLAGTSVGGWQKVCRLPCIAQQQLKAKVYTDKASGARPRELPKGSPERSTSLQKGLQKWHVLRFTHLLDIAGFVSPSSFTGGRRR